MSHKLKIGDYVIVDWPGKAEHGTRGKIIGQHAGRLMGKPAPFCTVDAPEWAGGFSIRECALKPVVSRDTIVDVVGFASVLARRGHRGSIDLDGVEVVIEDPDPSQERGDHALAPLWSMRVTARGWSGRDLNLACAGGAKALDDRVFRMAGL